jgi:hypothetical protein
VDGELCHQEDLLQTIYNTSEFLLSQTLNVIQHTVLEVSLLLWSALDILELEVKMLAKEIQVVLLFVTIMAMPSLLVSSVGEMDALLLTFLEYTLEPHLL